VKFRADRADLSAAASDAARALPSKASIPVMSGALVEAREDGTVTVSGYDYDTYISATVAGEVMEPGRVLVPGRVLAAFLASMPDGPVELVDEGARLRLSGKGCRYGLATMDVEDYPALPSPPPVIGRADGAALARAVPRAAVSARVGDGKIWWHGVVHLETTPECLLLGASDGNSASRTSVEWDGEPPVEDFAGEISVRLLTDAVRGLAGPVGLCMDDAQIGLQSAGRTVLSRRIGEQYVNWRRVVESLPTPGTVVRVLRDELAGAMQRAHQVLGNGTEPVRLRLGEGRLAYDLTSSGGNDLDGAIDVLHHDGDDLELGFAPQYLADAVKAAAGDVVELAIAGPTKVVVVRDPEASSSDLQLVMPKRLVTAR
jgi:DNA polymerase-3 subunit beta